MDWSEAGIRGLEGGVEVMLEEEEEVGMKFMRPVVRVENVSICGAGDGSVSFWI